MSRSEPYVIGSDIVARDIWTDVPLDWNDPEGETIRIFARELVAAERRDEDSFPADPAPAGRTWGQRHETSRAAGVGRCAALRRFRLIIPDQRGTGRSTPLSGSDFEQLSAEESARRLALHRADSIIRDFEAIRAKHYAGRQWWTLGQSYGGFLTMHYLSVAPEAIVASAVTGGLAALDPDPDELYRRTFPRMIEKNRQPHDRAPHLISRATRIADHLEANEVRLADGDRLTVRRFQTLGMDFLEWRRGSIGCTGCSMKPSPTPRKRG